MAAVLYQGTNGFNGHRGLDGTDSPDLATPAGNGGDGTDGTAGADISHVVTQADIDHQELDVVVTGGAGGFGGDGALPGHTFFHREENLSGNAESWHDSYSASGNGGNGGNGAGGGDAALTVDSVTTHGHLAVVANGGSAGWGGGGGTAFAGAGNYFEFNPDWMDTTPLSWTVDPSPGGISGHGGNGGDGGDAEVSVTNSTLHGSFTAVASGHYGALAGWGGNGTAGWPGTAGANGGNGGNGGNGAVTVHGNTFDFGAQIVTNVRSGAGTPGGMGGSGGYGISQNINGDQRDISYTYSVGGTGGNGGNGGDASLIFTGNTFAGTAANETLDLQFAVYLGAAGDAGRGGSGGLGGDAYTGTAGAAGAMGDMTLWIDGNLFDGGAGNDTLSLSLRNQTMTLSGDNSVGTITVNLDTGQFLINGGVNTVTNIENVSFNYWNLYYDASYPEFTTGNAVVVGNSADNSISGTSGSDSLSGGDGDDTLNGIAGLNDVLTGGAGDDTFYDHLGTTIVELGGGGIDTELTDHTVHMADNVENLVIATIYAVSATGNDLGNTMTGNDRGNVLNGLGGDDVIHAGGGIDKLYGREGNDVLDGGTEADRMYGGDGNDTYYVDDANDLVGEKWGQGTDRVFSSISFDATGKSIEYITLTGSDNINVTGSSKGNVLTGNAGNNLINGAGGPDRMYGGAGNDTYYVDNARDEIHEVWGAGTDVVYASVSFDATGQSIEWIHLTGSGNIDATGSSRGNHIGGNRGNNVLDGARGNDVLKGGRGADTFRFDAASGHDRVDDFSAAEGDRIDVHAYSGGPAFGNGVTIYQDGTSAIIDFGGGNSVTVLNTTATDSAFLDQIVW